MVVSCGIVAVYPDSVSTARTILVEPWLVMFCLPRGPGPCSTGTHLTSSRKRLLWGGVAFGFAGCVEVWAIFPVIVLVVMLPPADPAGRGVRGRGRDRLPGPDPPVRRLAPKRFYQSRTWPRSPRGPGSTRVPLPARLSHMLGISTLHLPAHPRTLILAATAVLVILLAAMIAVAWRVLRSAPPALDWW